MRVASRLRRHPYALGSIALLITVIGGGTLVLSRPWRSTVGAQGSVPAPPRIPVVTAAARTRDVGVYLKGLGTVTPLGHGEEPCGRRADRRPLPGGADRPRRRPAGRDRP